MSRDPRRLKVFGLADELVVEVYRHTSSFPMSERFGLQAQLRRAAVSVPTNLVEGCHRASTKDYKHFVTMAMASAAEVRYLVDLSRRLGFVAPDGFEALSPRYDELVRGLQGLVSALERRA